MYSPAQATLTYREQPSQMQKSAGSTMLGWLASGAVAAGVATSVYVCVQGVALLGFTLAALAPRRR